MSYQLESQIEGAFTGYHEDAIFKLVNGQVWQQSRYKYLYHYAYRPHVTISEETSGQHLMKVEGVSEPVEVRKISIVTEGVIVSDFEGFSSGASFKFQNGQSWIQRGSKYRHRHKNRPHAMVVDGINGYQLHVEGMDEAVRVRRN